MIGLVLVAWLVIAGMPFGRDEPKPRAATPPTDTIAEAQPQQSSTLVEVPAGAADDSFEISTTTTAAPPMATAPAPAPTTMTAPPSTPPAATMPAPTVSTPATRPPRPVVVAEQPRPQPPPQPREQPREQPRPEPAPVRVVPRQVPTPAEITGAEAEATLRNYVRSTRYYPVAAECIRVENNGYRNVGYNLEVWHSCAGGGASRLLGRWRVDSKTREVFRQQDDGRYLRP